MRVVELDVNDMLNLAVRRMQRAAAGITCCRRGKAHRLGLGWNCKRSRNDGCENKRNRHSDSEALPQSRRQADACFAEPIQSFERATVRSHLNPPWVELRDSCTPNSEGGGLPGREFLIKISLRQAAESRGCEKAQPAKRASYLY